MILISHWNPEKVSSASKQQSQDSNHKPSPSEPMFSAAAAETRRVTALQTAASAGQLTGLQMDGAVVIGSLGHCCEGGGGSCPEGVAMALRPGGHTHFDIPFQQ